MNEEIDSYIENLSSKQKLERDRSLLKLMNDFHNFDSSKIDCILSAFTNVIKRSDG